MTSDDDHHRRIAGIREEMRFEIGVFYARVNALISAEAFLLISFTAALAYVRPGSEAKLFWVSPVLSTVGFMLAALAWPGLNTSYKIIVEWNVLFVEALNQGHAAATIQWRPSVFKDGDSRIQADHRRGMLFSRFAPIIFMGAWAVLAIIAFFTRFG